VAVAYNTGGARQHDELHDFYHDALSLLNAAAGSVLKAARSNLSHVFAGQLAGIKQVEDRIWLVSFMQYDLGYFDNETCRLEPIENPFGPTVLPMSPE
jgi:putative transposase